MSSCNMNTPNSKIVLENGTEVSISGVYKNKSTLAESQIEFTKEGEAIMTIETMGTLVKTPAIKYSIEKNYILLNVNPDKGQGMAALKLEVLDANTLAAWGAEYTDGTFNEDLLYRKEK